MNDAVEKIIRDWKNGIDSFTVFSSGSTGDAKPFVFQRNLIELSCKSTGIYLGIQKSDSIFCCLPIDKTGGLMQIFRSLVWEIPIETVKPSTTPFLNYKGHGSIVSLTPMQLSVILNDEKQSETLKKFRIVLIGGSDISPEIEKPIADWETPIFYHTYGMTETYSHVAMRRIGHDAFYKFILLTEAQTNQEGCLMFKNALTENKWLQTNDLAQINADGSFCIKGRVDNIINSGGVKINPEEVEEIIAAQTALSRESFYCAGIKDTVLGEKLVLVILSGAPIPDLTTVQFNQPYLRPRGIIICREILRTETNKIKRQATLELSGNIQVLPDSHAF
jgi:O-succinylbenzoic acid--CoA ligase